MDPVDDREAAEHERQTRAWFAIRMSAEGRVSVLRDGAEVALSRPLQTGRWYRVEYGDWSGLRVTPRGNGRTLHAEVYPRGVAAARNARVRRQMRHVQRRAARRWPPAVVPTRVQVRINTRTGRPSMAIGGPVRPGSFSLDKVLQAVGTEYAVCGHG